MNAIRSSTRSIRRLAILLGTSGEACVRFLRQRCSGSSSLATRAQWLHQSCKLVLQRLEIDVSLQGSFPARGILVSNHLSYLDILVFGSLGPGVFVAKKEIRRWPIFGPMARMAGTIFIDRTRRSDARRANRDIFDALSAGCTVVLFPESTSSNGTEVLPFRPALFQAAVEAREAITPAHISYELSDGDAATEVCYWGTMTFFPHLLKMLSKGRVRAVVRIADEPQIYRDRKVAAIEIRESVQNLAKGADKMRSSPRQDRF